MRNFMSCNFYRDCLQLPIKKECFDYCMYEILLRANPKEKKDILHISAPTAEAVFYAFNTLRVSNFAGLAAALTANQLSELRQIFSNLTQAQLDYFANK